jgi:hypothetical protein
VELNFDAQGLPKAQHLSIAAASMLRVFNIRQQAEFILCKTPCNFGDVPTLALADCT